VMMHAVAERSLNDLLCGRLKYDTVRQIPGFAGALRLLLGRVVLEGDHRDGGARLWDGGLLLFKMEESPGSANEAGGEVDSGGGVEGNGEFGEAGVVEGDGAHVEGTPGAARFVRKSSNGGEMRTRFNPYKYANRFSRVIGQVLRGGVWRSGAKLDCPEWSDASGKDGSDDEDDDDDDLQVDPTLLDILAGGP
jgi:hypothetical protein